MGANRGQADAGWHPDRADLTAALPETAENVLALGLSPRHFRALVHRLCDRENPATTTVVVERAAIETALADFITALDVAALHDAGQLTILTPGDDNGTLLPDVPLVVADETASAIIDANDGTQSWVLADVDEDTASDLTAHYYTEVEGFREYEVTVPTLDELTAAAKEHLVELYAMDLETILDNAAVLGGEYDPTNIREVCVLLGARHRQFNDDISTFAEAVGLASSSTMNRVKRELEDDGVITHDQIAREAVRPEHQLRIDERQRALLHSDIEEFLGEIRSVR